MNKFKTIKEKRLKYKIQLGDVFFWDSSEEKKMIPFIIIRY